MSAASAPTHATARLPEFDPALLDRLPTPAAKAVFIDRWLLRRVDECAQTAARLDQRLGGVRAAEAGLLTLIGSLRGQVEQGQSLLDRLARATAEASAARASADELNASAAAARAAVDDARGRAASLLEELQCGLDDTLAHAARRAEAVARSATEQVDAQLDRARAASATFAGEAEGRRGAAAAALADERLASFAANVEDVLAGQRAALDRVADHAEQRVQTAVRRSANAAADVEASLADRVAAARADVDRVAAEARALLGGAVDDARVAAAGIGQTLARTFDDVATAAAASAEGLDGLVAEKLARARDASSRLFAGAECDAGRAAAHLAADADEKLDALLARASDDANAIDDELREKLRASRAAADGAAAEIDARFGATLSRWQAAAAELAVNLAVPTSPSSAENASAADAVDALFEIVGTADAAPSPPTTEPPASREPRADAVVADAESRLASALRRHNAAADAIDAHLQDGLDAATQDAQRITRGTREALAALLDRARATLEDLGFTVDRAPVTPADGRSRSPQTLVPAPEGDAVSRDLAAIERAERELARNLAQVRHERRPMVAAAGGRLLAADDGEAPSADDALTVVAPRLQGWRPDAANAEQAAEAA